MASKNDYVTDKALLKCTKGAAPVVLKVTSQFKIKGQNGNVATERDFVPYVNIKPFGICTELTKMAGGTTPVVCIPATTKWKDVNPDTTGGGAKKLLGKSTCKCTSGRGKISIVHPKYIDIPSKGKVVKGNPNYDAIVAVPCHRYPQSARHIKFSGKQDILTFDPDNASFNRSVIRPSISSLKKELDAAVAIIAKKTGLSASGRKGIDIDEWPAAMFRQGGAGASLNPIERSDNRGSGKYIQSQISNMFGKNANNKKIKLEVDCEVGCGMC